MKTATILMTIFLTLIGSVILADEIKPSYNSAVVDGNYKEWDLKADFAVAMHKAWRDGSDGKRAKAVLANAYLRYDCDANEMYVLVLAEKKYPVYVDTRGSDTYVKLDGHKMVSSRDVGNFAWIGVGFDGNIRHAIGWEAKFSVNDGEFGFTIHSNVYQDRAWQTAGSRGRKLEISCDENHEGDEDDNCENHDSGDDSCDFDGHDDCSHDKRSYLQLGKVRTGHNSEDGVEFYQNGKLIVDVPKKIQKGSEFYLRLKVVNTTGKKAYLAGWIDFNRDGWLQRNERVLSTAVKSTKKVEFQYIKVEIKVRNRRITTEPTVALFQISPNSCDTDSKKQGEIETYCVQFVEDPVAVKLSSFNATRTADGIKLEWKVEREVNHAGYNIYRSKNKESGYIKINDALINAWDGFSAFDGNYEYTDNVDGDFYYKLEAVDVDGSTQMFCPYTVQSATGVADKLEMPETFELKQNYPNPFNPTTTISFSLAERTNVNITIFDITGRVVTTLVDEVMDAGAHNLVWNAVNNFGEPLATGVYFYTMKTENFTATKSMTIMK